MRMRRTRRLAVLRGRWCGRPGRSLGLDAAGEAPYVAEVEAGVGERGHRRDPAHDAEGRLGTQEVHGGAAHQAARAATCAQRNAHASCDRRPRHRREQWRRSRCLPLSDAWNGCSMDDVSNERSAYLRHG